MRPSLRFSSSRRPSRGGFALVIALSLMAFVLLLLLSITTLVRVESQGAAITLERLRAEQNALLGLNLAIGELQKHAGRDQTVTARADLITDEDGDSSAAPETSYYTGVWDTQAETFSKWLASVADADGQLDPAGLTAEEDVNAAPSAPGTIVLKTLSTRDPDSGSVDSVDVVVDQVSVGADGSYAYWVADEGIKAKVDLVADETYYTALATADETDLALRTPLGAAPGIGFELLDDFPAALSVADKRTDANFRAQLRKLGSLQDTAHFGAMEAELSLLQPDVTTYSYGLLTNPKSGGLKKDLSLAFERGIIDWITDSDYVFEFENYDHPVGSTIDVKGPTWSVFQDHYNLYKEMSFTGGIPKLDTTDPKAHGSLDGTDKDEFYNYRIDYYDPMMDPIAFDRSEPQQVGSNDISSFEMPRAEEVQVSPVFLGNVVIVSLKIDSATKKLITILQPVAILWNPYNVKLETTADMKVSASVSLGLEFRFLNPDSPDADPNGYVYKGRGLVASCWEYAGIDSLEGARWFEDGMVQLNVDSGQTFAPGEIKLYASSQVGATSSELTTVDELFVETGAGYHISSWRKLSRGGGLGIANYSDINKKRGRNWFYSSDGMIVEPTVQSIDLALEPNPVFYDRTGLGLGHHTKGPFFQKRILIPLDLGKGDYADEPMGSFSLVDAGNEFSGGSKQGIGFFRTDISVDDLDEDQYMAIAMVVNLIGSPDDVNNTLQAPSAMEAHLSSNPRAPFTSSTVGTYAHFKMNPNVIFEAQQFAGLSTLEERFYDLKYPYFGMSYETGVGQFRPIAWEFPLNSLTSLAQMQHVFFNRDSYEPSYAVGNSFASPYLYRDEAISSVGPIALRYDGGKRVAGTVYDNWTGSAIDYSYKLNEALWDGYFFSSLAPIYEDGNEVQGLDSVIEEFADGAQPLQNSRMQLYLSEDDDFNRLVRMWTSSRRGNKIRSAERIAANLLVEGAFNVNSTSVQAWKAFLASLYEKDIAGMKLQDPDYGTGSNLELKATPEGAVFSRFSLPTLDESHPSDPTEIRNNPGSGYRVLDAGELDALAVEVVKQVKLRGPFLSLADFVNRDLSTGTEGLMGPLQQAINDAGLNDDYALGLPGEKGGVSTSRSDTHDIFLDPEAGTGSSYGAGPGYLLQGDILNSLGPFLTVKSNTFVIRTCGESIDPISGETSQVYLEAVVQQVPDFVDPSDDSYDEASTVTNEQFGRRFKLVQVRRLDPDKI
jgi:hypothetical protein